MNNEIYDVIVIGAGQAGLAISHYLNKDSSRFLILEKENQVASTWRSHYDSLRLITPMPYNNLPGKAFKASETFPKKQEVVDYMDDYSKDFFSKIQFNTSVLSVKKEKDLFLIHTSSSSIPILKSKKVVVASGYNGTPFIPEVAKQADPNIIQLHSSEYKNPCQLNGSKNILIVGSGNSGVNIAKELSQEFNVFLAEGKIKRLPRKIFGKDIFWCADKMGAFNLSRDSKLGSKLSKKLIPLGDATYGVYPKKTAEEYNFKLLSRIVKIKNKEVFDADGVVIEPDTIVWSTGFRPVFSTFIDFPIFEPSGIPRHARGVTEVEGLYFLGLKWQFNINSFLIFGVGRDAEYIFNHMKKELLLSE